MMEISCWLGQSSVTLVHCQAIIGNSLTPVQNGSHFTDDTFSCIFVNEKSYIFIKISLKIVPKGQIDNNPALVHIMAWRRIGDKPLSESMLTRFTDAYRGRWVNSLAPGRFKCNFKEQFFKLNLVIHSCDINWRIALRWLQLDPTDDKSTSVQVMAWCRQAASHYLSQCRLSSLLSYSIISSQWVNHIMHCFLVTDRLMFSLQQVL